MNTIKGKNYFASFGYVKDLENGVYVKDIENIFIQSKKGTALFMDDSDKENIITIPLVAVNQIQVKDGLYKFHILVSPQDMDFGDKDMLSINTIGLFEEYRKDGKEFIKHIQFFKCETSHVVKKDTAKTFIIEIEKDKIDGGN